MMDLTNRMFTLEQARILAGYTQLQLAEKMGMSGKTYIQYEKYRKVFRMDDAYKFSQITGMDLKRLIFFEDQLQKNCS